MNNWNYIWLEIVLDKKEITLDIKLFWLYEKKIRKKTMFILSIAITTQLNNNVKSVVYLKSFENLLKLVVLLINSLLWWMCQQNTMPQGQSQ